MARISVFLIVVALIAGMIGCGGQSCVLAITSSAGGNVTTPGEGIFVYDEGTVVILTAEAEQCYSFVSWTGNVSTITNLEAANTNITMNGNYFITANFEQEEPVYFADPNLEAAVREAIGKPTGPICPSNLNGFLNLNAEGRSISILTGLERCTSLTWLLLGGNQISDILPLATLTDLTYLNLCYNQVGDVSPLTNLENLTELLLYDNPITDISPLSDLISLTKLKLGETQIADISPLFNLTNLTWLDLSYNQISDISALANLTNLTWLDLWTNQISNISPLANLTNLALLALGADQISDISPLANLSNLTNLILNDNEISDISPLVQNEGLGAGDYIDMRGNPLNSDSINIYIPQLQARGVTVHY